MTGIVWVWKYAGEAEDGEEALKKILEEKPDILIMDINIPYMNGIEVSKK